MTRKIWDGVKILSEKGEVNGIAPLIISASRSTDIPAYYSSWFMNRLEKGYVKWINPFNSREQYVSLERARAFVFWSKDPLPLMGHLDTLDSKGLYYYFQFTLNDYEKEGLEPGLRKLKERILTFKTLSEKIGKERVIWRFDPLVLTRTTDEKVLLERVENIGKQLKDHTKKLVISFADISSYRRVKNSFIRNNKDYEEFNRKTMISFAHGLKEVNRELNLEIATCCEDIDLLEYGIKRNKCIDDGLLPKEGPLVEFLEKCGRDKGQRAGCLCIPSKDIGRYNTCPAGCIYCYANQSIRAGKENYRKHLEGGKNTESIL